MKKGAIKMKILQINAVYGNGSTGNIVRDIHELCLSKNIDSFVAYSLSNIPENEIKNGYKQNICFALQNKRYAGLFFKVFNLEIT